MINDKNKISEIREAIVKAVAFFDMFDYVLTDFEIWRMLGVKCEFIDVVKELENIGSAVENKNGFYFLPGREKNIIERLRRYNFADRKFKRAIFAAKIFRFIPWVKMIAVGNLIGAHNMKDGGDIDFFIIAEKKRVWIARFFCAGIAEILRLRPKDGNSRDKICLSFYASESAMDLSGLMMRQENDIYFIYWLAGLVPIYDVGGAYENFIKANRGILSNLPNWNPIIHLMQRLVKPFSRGFYHDLADLLVGGLEAKFQKAQIKLLPPKLKNLMNQGSRVVVNDEIIKLHANDRREEYAAKHKEKIKELAGITICYEIFNKNN